MTVGPRSQCNACRHLRPKANLDDPFTCTAFTDAIPDTVYGNELDHRKPVEGDHGIQFQAKPGDEFPEYALQ
jgi:hypothetical protein